MNFDLCTLDWTAIAAIVSLLMVVVTCIALWQNHKQLKELKRQWEESKRPRLSFSIIPSQSWYVLKISNIGKDSAFDIKVNFNDTFLEQIPISNAQKFFIKIKGTPFALEGGRSKFLLLCECDNAYKYWKEKGEKMIITGSYCNIYPINETLDITQYTIGGSIVDNELTNIMGYIKKGLIVQSPGYYPIQKSLDIIAKEIARAYESKKSE